MADQIKKTIKDVDDSVKEGIHRGNAEAERELRSEYGDVMTPKEKAGSTAREVSENTKAEIDKAKRKLRDSV